MLRPQRGELGVDFSELRVDAGDFFVEFGALLGPQLSELGVDAGDFFVEFGTLLGPQRGELGVHLDPHFSESHYRVGFKLPELIVQLGQVVFGGQGAFEDHSPGQVQHIVDLVGRVTLLYQAGADIV